MLIAHDVDLCVIGSGPAGSILAYVCAQAGVDVLLLEAGPRLERDARYEMQQRHLITGLDPWPKDARRDVFTNGSPFDYPLNANRVRAVGGTTLHWIGMTPRLRESDFRTQSLFGLGVDWPVDYATLEPYYCRAEQEMGVSGARGESDPWRSAPYPMEPFPDSFGDALWRRAASSLGVRLDTMPVAKNNLRQWDGRPPCATFSTCTICPIGAQYSADWHAIKAESTGRCVILADTSARRLEADASGRIRLVYATSRNGDVHEIRARFVVVAASAVETARLLLLSDVGNPNHVGRHLMEHWKIAANGVSGERDYPHRIGFPTLTAYHKYEGSDRRTRGAVRLLFPNPDNPLNALATRPGLWGRALAAHDCARFGHQRRIEASVEHQPNDASRVTLDHTVTDIHGDAAPRITFTLDDVDHRTLDVARVALREFAEAAQLEEVRVGEGFYGGAHMMGTCRMAAREEDGVATPDAQVYGARNLFLAGSALFPTGGAVNPTLTIAALSLRLADHLMRLLGDARMRAA